MNEPVQNLKGFRDFIGDTKIARDRIEASIVKTFQLFGFSPLETPTLEYASLLMGKYGAEADKLVYNFEDRGGRQVALKYDQTVPTARVIAQYQGQLPRFFRRYQIQNVFRAEKPQKGRYREFKQCDIDIFGTTSVVADAEIIACTYAAIAEIGFKNVEIWINDRAILIEKLTPFATDAVNVFSIIQSVDKLDKQTAEEVVAELVAKGLEKSAAESALASINSADITDNLRQIIAAAEALGVPSSALKFTPSLARGLDYYTGMIFEVKSKDYGNSSLAGGGRYDNLIEKLGGPAVPAVGVAFGFDRIVELATESGIALARQDKTRVMILAAGEGLLANALQLTAELRDSGIVSEVYPQAGDKLGKQIKYAVEQGYPYAIIVGEQEVAEGKYQLKQLSTGESWLLAKSEIKVKLA